jgi:uncharacterized protein
MKLEDLSEGMELSGTVLNVVDFGVFVDIGLHDSGLVHVSRLANRFVKDPNEVISIGDIVHVWVTGIDKSRRRVSLTMIPPGTEREGARRSRKWRPDASLPEGTPAGSGPPAGEAAPAGATQGHSRRGRRPYPANAVATTSHSRPPNTGGSRRPPPPRPKPLKPITKKMLQGKEPMRTFGDLLQFVKHQSEDQTVEAQKKQGGAENQAEKQEGQNTPPEKSS